MANSIGLPNAPLYAKMAVKADSENSQVCQTQQMSTRAYERDSSIRPRILICDDQHDILTALELLLKIHGYQTKAVDSPQDLLAVAQQWPFELILMDLNYTRDTTSGQEGLDLIKALRRSHSASPIVAMTAWSNVELAVEAMRSGASDFVQKPWDNTRLLQTVSKELKRTQEAREAEAQSKSELEIARNVQQKLFPQRFKKLKTLEYAGNCIPARAVGGDYFDFLDTGEGLLATVLADVSGKGVAAAMLMANLQACLRTQLEAGVRRPEELLQRANQLFFESTPPSQYVTLFFAEFDENTRRLTYLNCGHPAPILLRSGGKIERLDATATVLGLFSEWRATGSHQVTLNAGDLLVLFSDGIPEAILPDGTEFGEERLIDATELCGDAAVEQCVSKLIALTNHASNREATDDRTIVVLRCR